MNANIKNEIIIVTAGSSYLDIDAYACIIAMVELLRLCGKNAFAFSKAPLNYSVCDSLVFKEKHYDDIPSWVIFDNIQYIIVDVSDPEYIKDSVLIEKVLEVYDHHAGFEEYWNKRIGEGAHIEFIGAAATLVARKWKQYGLLNKMSRSTALLLIAAILDNTLNLASKNTTDEDIQCFHELCKKAKIDKMWCVSYFSEVQKNVESDLHNALLKDLKIIQDNPILPKYIAQLCVWDAGAILEHLSEIRKCLNDCGESWMVNVIDIHKRCSYFICDDEKHQREIEKAFDIQFDNGIAKTSKSYLRKEILKKTLMIGGNNND